VQVQQSQHLHAALTEAGAAAKLTVLPGAQHEDPAFMHTQLTATYAFLDSVFAR